MAIESFEKAIEIEPDWAAPYAGLSSVGGHMNQFGIGSESERIRMIYENLNKALELNPSNVRNHSFYAHLLTILRRTDEALYEGKLSVELDPGNPSTLGLYVEVLFHEGKCQEQLFYLEKALAIDPDFGFLRGKMDGVNMCFGDYKKVFEDWKEKYYDSWQKMGYGELLVNVFYEQGWIAFNQELINLFEEEMAKGIQVSPWLFYNHYFILGKYDKAMDYLEITYEDNHNNPGQPFFKL